MLSSFVVLFNSLNERPTIVIPIRGTIKKIYIFAKWIQFATFVYVYKLNSVDI